MPIRATLLLLLLLTVAGVAAAQVTVIPANPIEGTVVQFSVTRALDATVTVTQTGNVFRIDIGPPLVLVDPPFLTTTLVSVGQLPAGTYTFEVFNDTGTLIQRGTFAVQLVPIPALSPRGIGALAVMLVIAGWFAISRKM